DLYENAPCGYLSTLLDGTIVKINRTFLQWTGYRAEDLVGIRKFSQLLSPGGRIFYETHYAPMLRMQGSVREIAVDLVCSAGGTLPVLLNSVLKCNNEGVPVLARTTIFDATERRSYERELLRAKQSAEESQVRAALLAETLQRSLIPPALPPVPGLQLAASYRPAGLGDQVGGDFYDVFETASNDWAVTLGDVCGKGPEAATVTALARHTIRATAMRGRRPSRILGALNEALLLQRVERFCTVVYARLQKLQGRWRVTLTSGGHPLPVHVTADSASPIGRPGDLIGVLDHPRLHDTRVELRPREALVFYTDGVTEGRSGNEFYGEDRLLRVLRSAAGASAAEIVDAVTSDVIDFQQGTTRDDLAVLAVCAPAL
ncbi:MAG TPA: SpoIIE family protein phosphatase, partial [Acidimicrobiia bacterium]|nr:SpoIIE family protein phosphatase [Acidimicrobiia bacterium]